MSQTAVDNREVLDRLTAIAELDLYPAVEQRAGVLFELIAGMIAADFAELTTASAVNSGLFQVSAIFGVVQQQGTQIANEVTRLTELIRAHLASLSRCASTPQKMSALGKAWRQQVDRITEMIRTAERLADQPDWKGRASAAHLAVVPKQIQAMRDLNELAGTAAESVLLVGAIQSNIFDACGLILTQAIEQLRGHVSTAPTAYFSRCAAAVTLLTNVDVLLTRWLSGEGTWSPSATQIAEGLSDAPTGGFEWPKAVSSPSTKRGAGSDKGGDGWQSTVTEEGITVTGPIDAEAGPTEPGEAAPDETPSAGEPDIVVDGDGETEGFGSVSIGDLAVGAPGGSGATTPVEPALPAVSDEAPTETVAAPPVAPPVAATSSAPDTPSVPDTTFEDGEVVYKAADLIEEDIAKGRLAWELLNGVEALR